MIDIQTGCYRLSLNPRSGTIGSMRGAGDPEFVNLAHIDAEAGFGNLVYTRRSETPAFEEYASPIGVPGVRLREYRSFANLQSASGRTFRFENGLSQLAVTYRFHEEYFDIELECALEDADQIGLDLNVAFMDLRQTDAREYQFTPQSFYVAEDRSLAYVYLAKLAGCGMFIHSLTECAGWRLLYGYGGDFVVRGLQMLRRFDSRLDAAHAAEAGKPVKFAVRVSFPASLTTALDRLQRQNGMPRPQLPLLSTEAGGALPFLPGCEVAGLTLRHPDGRLEALPPDCRQIRLPDPGFYLLHLQSRAGGALDIVLQASLPWLETLKRACRKAEPTFGACAEGWYWAQGFALARRWFGPDRRIDDYLHDALCLVGMQGVEPPANPPAPPREETMRRLTAGKPDYPVYQPGEKFFMYVPCPEEHTFLGIRHAPFHLYRWERIQDQFALIQTYLLAADAYGEDGFYEHAIRLAEAMIADHLAPDGSLRCVREWERVSIDYTTVIAPLQALVELYLAMCRKADARSERLREICLKIADYLVARDLEFPTEGCSCHLRWTEDGSIACTALSVLFVYHYVEADVRYLELARRVMEFHRIWQLTAPDARVEGSSYRYWETQWENDGEGRAINAGHAWTLWQAEALFYLALSDNDPEALLDSYNGYRTNLCKYMPDGTCYSCFTPDYLPQRPRRFELCHCYPKKPDNSLAFYLWPRSVDSWLKTFALIAPERLGLSPELGVIGLNCRVEESGGRLAVTPLAPFAEQVFIALPEEKEIVIHGAGPLNVLGGPARKISYQN